MIKRRAINLYAYMFTRKIENKNNGIKTDRMGLKKILIDDHISWIAHRVPEKNNSGKCSAVLRSKDSDWSEVSR